MPVDLINKAHYALANNIHIGYRNNMRKVYYYTLLLTFVCFLQIRTGKGIE